MTGILSALSEGELKIMELLWSKGGLSAWEIAFGLSKNNPVSESTVRTVMRLLTDKGYVRYDEALAKFETLIAPEQARAQVVRYLLRRFFQDSPALLIQDLLADGKLDAVERQRRWAELNLAVA